MSHRNLLGNSFARWFDRWLLGCKLWLHKCCPFLYLGYYYSQWKYQHWRLKEHKVGWGLHNCFIYTLILILPLGMITTRMEERITFTKPKFWTKHSPIKVFWNIIAKWISAMIFQSTLIGGCLVSNFGFASVFLSSILIVIIPSDSISIDV